jgi:hypothetical protein
MMRKVFVSYSRSEFNYAEALASSLQSSGFEVWFDNQALQPGVNWREGIDAGLAWCDSVFLVASREAIRKEETVGKEWKHALTNRKPLYVLAFEEVILPEEIVKNAQGIVDGRGDFLNAAAILIGCAQRPNRACPRHIIPPPNRFRIPRRIPKEVRALVVGLLLSSLYLLGISGFCGLTSFSGYIDGNPNTEGFGVLAAGALFGLLTVCTILFVLVDTFRNRHKRYEALRNLFLIRRYVYIWLLATFVYLFPIWLLFRMLKTENAGLPAVYRWGGRGGRRLRMGPQERKANPSARRVTYRLFHADADARPAREVQRELEAFGHRHADEAPEYNLLVLSMETAPATIQEALGGTARLIPIIARNMDISAPHIAPILDFQVLDYRRRELYPIRALALVLQQPDQHTTFSDMIEPTAFDRYLRQSLWGRVQPYYEATPLPDILYPIRNFPWPYTIIVVSAAIAFVCLLATSVYTPPQSTAPTPFDMTVLEAGLNPGFLSDSQVAGTLSAQYATPTPTINFLVTPLFVPGTPIPGGAETIIARVETVPALQTRYPEVPAVTIAMLQSYYGDLVILDQLPVTVESEGVSGEATAYLLPITTTLAFDSIQTIPLSTASTTLAAEMILIPWPGWLLRIEGADDAFFVHILPNLLDVPETEPPENIEQILDLVLTQ